MFLHNFIGDKEHISQFTGLESDCSARYCSECGEFEEGCNDPVCPGKNAVRDAKFAQWVCRRFKHRYVDHGHYSSESGTEHIMCDRCGDVLIHHTYY